MDLKRFRSVPEESFFLLGPRGTGKTWWTRRNFPEALRVDLLDPATLRQMMARPEKLRELVSGHSECRDVVIDEVQKLPELLEVVHGLIEEKQGRRFVLTGSSARKLRRAGVNLLGGRAAQLAMHPFMASELGEEFSLKGAMQYGMLPVVMGSKDREAQIQAYCGVYLREEVQAEGLVRNVGNFARFLEAISFSHGAVLNLANVARECHVKRPTLEGYLSILEDLLLAWRLPVFTRKAKRELAQHPKFYYFDTGIFVVNRPRGPLDAPSEIDGAALEGLVAQHLKAWCDYSSGKNELFYWQTRSKVEVDFVVYGPNHFFALEVKNTDKIRPDDLQGLRSFAKDYPESKRFFLYRGEERLLQDGILCIPCEEFLKNLKPDVFPE